MATIHKETGKIFSSRKEAKKYFGRSRYIELLKDNQFIFTSNRAINELYSNTKIN